MKAIEAIIPRANVQPTVKQLYRLGVEEITVESVQVFKHSLHQAMIHRGCSYEQGFTPASKLRFHVQDHEAANAETIVAHALNG